MNRDEAAMNVTIPLFSLRVGLVQKGEARQWFPNFCRFVTSLQQRGVIVRAFATTRFSVSDHIEKENAVMMRTVTLCILALVLMAGQALAAPAAKVAVVDLKRAVAECKEGVAARAELLKETEQFNAELKVMLAEFEKMRAELEKDASKLSGDVRAEKEALLQKKGREYQNRQREALEEVKQLEADYLKKIVNKLGVIMGKIGDEGKFGVILDRNAGVFYTGKEMDITPLLIQRADAEFGKPQARN